MKNMFEILNEVALKLVDSAYCDSKNFSKEEKESILEDDNIKYYYYVGKDEQDVGEVSDFFKELQNNAISIAQANKIETNRDNILDEDDKEEFDETGYMKYIYFQIYLINYNDEYYILSKPILMQTDNDVLMIQRCSSPIEAKLKFHEFIVGLRKKQYDISLLKNIDIL